MRGANGIRRRTDHGHRCACMPADLFPAEAYDVQRFERAEDVEKFQITTDKVLGPQGRSQGGFCKPPSAASCRCLSSDLDQRLFVSVCRTNRVRI
jgi:hypothetical protein